jgi:hypothetical protein
MVTGNDCVATFKPLHPTRIIDWFSKQILIRNTPYFVAFGVHLNHQVAQGAAYQGIAIG